MTNETLLKVSLVGVISVLSSEKGSAAEGSTVAKL
jgi:hypothetical protein